MQETPWFQHRGVDERPYGQHERILARRSAFWLLLLACAVLAAFAHYARGCDALIVTGFAQHADRNHHYRSFTTGAGCEFIRGNWRADAVAFLNSNTHRTLLLGGSWLPLKAGPVSAGISAGDALFGYDRTHQLAGGITVELFGRAFGADATYIPRVDGMKGAVLWIRPKVLRGWEPLK